MNNNSITSKVMGVVYMDLVAYILPGFLLLSGIFLIYGDMNSLLCWLKTAQTMCALAFLIITAGGSYILGSGLSLVLWSINNSLEGRWAWMSMARLLRSKKSQGFLQRFYERVGLPSCVRVKLRDRIQEDLGKLGLLDPSDPANKGEPSEELVTFFWDILREVSRESNSRLFQYWYRWDAVDYGRQNALGAAVVLLLLLSVKILVGSQNWVALAFVILVMLLAICLYVLCVPLARYWNMRCFLISYLTRGLKVVDDKSAEMRKEPTNESGG